MNQDITITIIDRDGAGHIIEAPTDMAMNLMEVVRSYELAPEGTIGVCGGMAMCASCQGGSRLANFVSSTLQFPQLGLSNVWGSSGVKWGRQGGSSVSTQTCQEGTWAAGAAPCP